MKLSARTIVKLAELVNGNNDMAPYRKGSELVDLFNRFGFNEHYGSDFGARKTFTETKLNELNGNDALRSLVHAVFDAREFLEHPKPIHEAAAHLNQFLKYDGYELAAEGDHYRIRSLGSVSVSFSPSTPDPKVDAGYIAEQVGKCERKISEGDYDGAITNARTLLEAVLLELEKLVTGAAQKYDGDLTSLYKRVQKELNLHPSRSDISDTIRQVLSGLNSIVNGLAGMRNKMSDAHAGYKPAKHHAKLAVNAAKTMADFLFETYAYQQAKRKE